MVERTVRDREVGGSNPLAPTSFLKSRYPIKPVFKNRVTLHLAKHITGIGGNPSQFLNSLHGFSLSHG